MHLQWILSGLTLKQYWHYATISIFSLSLEESGASKKDFFSVCMTSMSKISRSEFSSSSYSLSSSLDFLPSHMIWSIEWFMKESRQYPLTLIWSSLYMSLPTTCDCMSWICEIEHDHILMFSFTIEPTLPLNWLLSFISLTIRHFKSSHVLFLLKYSWYMGES
jgi:hypothetical protein